MSLVGHSLRTCVVVTKVGLNGLGVDAEVIVQVPFTPHVRLPHVSPKGLEGRRITEGGVEA